jgi:hypothetical protein
VNVNAGKVATNFEGNNMLKRNKANNSWGRILFVESVTFPEVAK